ncbi:MAG: aminotransferase, partial [Duodenibacillus sp.]|nr:aminotransferase [Duodenibacillus sp.]
MTAPRPCEPPTAAIPYSRIGKYEMAAKPGLNLALPPDVISFAGGLPSPQGFPVAAVEEACRAVLAREGRHALQYSLTEGE